MVDTQKTTFQSQLTSLHSVDLSSLLSVSIQLKSKNLESLLTQLIEAQTRQALFLDSLEQNFATKAELRDQIKDSMKKVDQKVATATESLQNRIQPLETQLSDTQSQLSELKKQQENEYNLVMERFVEIERDTNEKINDILMRSEDLKVKTNAAMSRMKRDNEAMETRLQKDIKQVADEKASKEDAEKLTQDIRSTQKKMKQLKEKIQGQMEKKIEKKVASEMKAVFTPIRENLEQQLASKANQEEMRHGLNQKADKSVVDQKADRSTVEQKADHTNTLRLFENVKRQLEDSMRELGHWGQELQSELDMKAYRTELELVDHKVSAQISTGEKNNSASARYRCLCCGSVEPIDQTDNSKNRESFLFPSGRPKTASGVRSPSNYRWQERVPPKEKVGKDGRVYLVDRDLPQRRSPLARNGTGNQFQRPASASASYPGGGGGTSLSKLNLQQQRNDDLSSHVDRQLSKADASPLSSPRTPGHTVKMPSIKQSPRSHHGPTDAVEEGT